MIATLKRWLFEPPRPYREASDFLPYVCEDGPLKGDKLWLDKPETHMMRINGCFGRYVGQPWDRGTYFSLSNKLYWEEEINDF